MKLCMTYWNPTSSTFCSKRVTLQRLESMRVPSLTRPHLPKRISNLKRRPSKHRAEKPNSATLSALTDLERPTKTRLRKFQASIAKSSSANVCICKNHSSNSWSSSWKTLCSTLWKRPRTKSSIWANLLAFISAETNEEEQYLLVCSLHYTTKSYILNTIL